LVRKALFIIAKIFMRMTTRVQLLGGLENVPDSGGALLAINHLGRLDAVIVFIHIKRADFTGWVADKYREIPLLSPIVDWLDGIWINREGVDRKALRIAKNRLREGWLLGIAPEGTRSPTGGLIEGKEGIAYIAAKTGVDIIPVAITGTEKVWVTWKRMRRPNLTVRFGKPFRIPTIAREHREQMLQRGIDEIMCRLGALLPEKYHGVYRQHPRLLELLQSDAQ